MNKRWGFTIVELLIVIVVIGILAAIVIVAYNGVQSKANDTAVQSDIRNLAVKILEQQALTGDLPAAAPMSIAGIPFFHPSKNSYSLQVHNLYYCLGVINGTTQFVVAAVSKSGKKFMYGSDRQAGEYTGAWDGSSTNCPGLGFTGAYTYSYGYNKDTGSWSTWIN